MDYNGRGGKKPAEREGRRGCFQGEEETPPPHADEQKMVPRIFPDPHQLRHEEEEGEEGQKEPGAKREGAQLLPSLAPRPLSLPGAALLGLRSFVARRPGGFENAARTWASKGPFLSRVAATCFPSI